MDDLGNVVARYQFHAFGQPSAISIEGDAWQSLTPDQWSAMTPELWAELPVTLLSSFGAGGQKQYYLDQDTGLLLLGMGSNGRYMDPATARFMTQDPIGLAGGDANLYRLTGNDPVNQTDPSGHGGNDDPANTRSAPPETFRWRGIRPDFIPPGFPVGGGRGGRNGMGYGWVAGKLLGPRSGFREWEYRKLDQRQLNVPPDSAFKWWLDFTEAAYWEIGEPLDQVRTGLKHPIDCKRSANPISSLTN